MSTMAESSTDMIEALSDRSISRSSAHSPVSYGPTKLRGSKVEYSHKLTEKRRRDRMNSSMSEIAQLLPSSSPSKQLEKAEILEKTITYIKKLQEITGKQEPKTGRKSSDQHLGANRGETPSEKADSNSDYYSGFSDCIKEVFHCLTNVEAMDLQQPCFQRLMCHLQNELKFMFVERGGSEQDEHLDTSSNGDSDNVTSTRGPKTALGCKRSHDSIEAGTPQEPHSSFNPAKRQHISDYNNCSESTLCSRESDISLSSLTPQETMSPSSSGTGGNGHSKKEKQKAVLNGVSFWIGSGSPLSNPESSSDKEKREGLSPSTNMFDKVNGEGSGCVNEAVGGNHKWQNNGLDLPVVATPIPPRTPYISNPYTVPTYALHPSGTHYIPVVLHMNIAPPSLPEINGSFNPVANMAALTFMRMGGLHYPPYFPCGVPFVPPVSSGINGVNGLHNPKQESTQKQCVSKSREVDSSTSVLESHSGNECSTTDTLIL